MSQATTVKEVLIAARWMIDNVGWCQGVYAKYPRDPDSDLTLPGAAPCAFCALGALYQVNTTPELRMKARDVVAKIAHADSIPIWNDSPNTTKKQVLEVYDAAIKQATK